MKAMTTLVLTGLASVMYSFAALAQEIPAADSSVVQLDEVIIEGIDYTQYALGMNTRRIQPPVALQPSLSEVLSREAGINMVNYGGTGQLSTINMRGLGTSRTSLLWQGMEINSFTLGLVDYSLLPASAASDITVYHGAGSSLFGNGALGGTISLQSAAPVQAPTRLGLHLGTGSYGRREIGLSHSASHNNIAWQVRQSSIFADNNYRYALGDSTVEQDNAAVQLHSLTGDIHFRGKKQWNGSIHAWYQYNDREIQPSVTDIGGDDQILNKTLRLLGKLYHDGHTLSHEFKAGYSSDWQQYNQDAPIITQRYFGSWEAAANPGTRLSLRAGINWNHLRPEVPAFAAAITENRNDLYGSVLYNTGAGWQMGSNLRLPMVNGAAQAFSPTLFVQRKLIKKQSLNLDMRAQASRNFRLPTLNDRYWNPGGNPDLLPELAHSIESSLHLNITTSEWKAEGSLSGFYHDVDNWIIWIPGGSGTDAEGNTISFWYPDNVRRVVARGLNLQQQISKSAGEWTMELGLSANYTRSTNEEALNRFDRSKGKQLPYTPRWQGQMQIAAGKAPWRLWLQVQHTGERYVETNNELPPLEAYQLLSMGIDLHAGKPDKEGIRCQLLVDNLLNTNYENYQNRAMPGRNYRISLTIPIIAILRKP